jgi:hypothetical protein
MSSEAYAENEEYNLDDIINLNRIERKNVKNIKNKFNKKFKFEEREFNIEDINDVKNLLEDILNIIKNIINPNINKFISMNYNDKKLEVLYKDLENISKNKGSYKEILEIANKIELIEKEKESISDSDIEITVNYLKKIIDIFSNFEYILENRYLNYED